MAIHQITDAGIPVANGLPSCLNSISPKDPNHVKTNLKASAEKIQAIGSSSTTTLNPGTCLSLIISLEDKSSLLAYATYPRTCE